MGKGSGDIVIGYKYAFGIHMGIGRGPVDELIEIKVGDKTAWRGSITENGDTVISQPELFGGTSGEGGIDGTLTAMFGNADQVTPSHLSAVLKSPMPNFRRMFTLFFDGVVTMMNPYPKPWKMRVRRTHRGWDGDPWYPEKARISLVRPTSQGETTGGTTEVKDVATSGQYTPVLTVPDFPRQWTVTVDPPGDSPLVSVDFVYIRIGDPNLPGDLQFYYLTEGTHYTKSGAVLTFTETADTESQSGMQYGDALIGVDYTYTLTTFDPIGGNVGDALIASMNGVHIVYECMTNREWGRGLPRSMFNDANWRYAADVLFQEQFGLCMRWVRKDEIKTFIQEVLNHIGAVLYDNRKTGKIEIKLMRDDYKKSETRFFDNTSGLISISEDTSVYPGRMINELIVKYRDPVTDEERLVRVSNLAAIQASGGIVNSKTVSYLGVPTPELAGRLALRDLKAMSPSIRRFQLELDRRGYNITPGGVIRIQDLSRRVTDMVVRVVTLDYGRLGDGKIRVSALQDVFSTPQRGFTTIGPPAWVPPANAKACIGLAHAFEAPYRSLYRKMNPADFDYLDENSAYTGVVVQMGHPLNASYQVASKVGVSTPDELPPDDSYQCEV